MAAIGLALAFGYFCGAIPFGLLLTKGFGAGDVRTIGSGNIGATNVLRTGRTGLAAATLILDALKGAVAVWAAGAVAGPHAAMAAGFGAFLGHIFPAWLGFKGGKGVATYVGVALGLDPRVAGVFAFVWLATALLTRYSSLAALAATLAAPLAAAFFGRPAEALLFAAMTAILFWTHRENIGRLAAGRESRIGRTG